MTRIKVQYAVRQYVSEIWLENERGVQAESRSGQEKTWIDYAEAQRLLKSKSLKCNA